MPATTWPIGLMCSFSLPGRLSLRAKDAQMIRIELLVSRELFVSQCSTQNINNFNKNEKGKNPVQHSNGNDPLAFHGCTLIVTLICLCLCLSGVRR